ncbi:hypothetical protein GE300_13145 [Rhodobacteraceae bacterium 2CG4]|uniref:UrcA family protein n=1 Tax=Halovulum marinum TaxID=2662447 RepID=A0A6L5Z1V3_9RHOB|nr:hypothetical protein [Halovulum marinum]MSU90551.1 hypothetical protein [Halovulum marinum]
MTLKAFLAALLLATATPAVPAAAEFDRTCAYFSNVAYNDRFTREYLTFRIRLADDCADALAVLDGARPG